MATTRAKKIPVAAEVSVKDAMALLKINKDKQGRQWERVVSIVRDPKDLTRIIGVFVHEAA